MQTMLIGVPKEVKREEYRVAITPAGVEALTEAGHQVVVECGAGVASGFSDDLYAATGAQLVNGPEGVWSDAELILKVKEPTELEWLRMRAGQVLFTYFHFAASRALTQAVMDSGAVAIAYDDGRTEHRGTAFADAHERGCRATGGAGGGAILGTALGRIGCAAFWRPRGVAGQGPDPGRWGRGRQRGQDRRWYGRPRVDHGREPRPAPPS